MDIEKYMMSKVTESFEYCEKKVINDLPCVEMSEEERNRLIAY